jgi:transcriptional regulator NrdR family protein
VLRKDGDSRRRECCLCHHRWTTIEVGKDRFDRAIEAVTKVKALAVELERS